MGELLPMDGNENTECLKALRAAGAWSRCSPQAAFIGHAFPNTPSFSSFCTKKAKDKQGSVKDFINKQGSVKEISAISATPS